MARFPRLIDAAVLLAAASPHETHAMRVEVRGVPSNVPYRLAGKGVQRYLLTYDPPSSAHIIDIPAGLWMEDRESLARDLLGGPHSKNLVVLTVPWGASEHAAEDISTAEAADRAMQALDPEQTATEEKPPQAKKPSKPRGRKPKAKPPAPTK